MKLANSGVVFNEAEHSYMLDGMPLIGITAFIDAVLCCGDPSNGVYVQVPKWVLERAAERGKRIHSDIELMCCGFSVDTEECNAVRYLLPEYDYRAEYIVTDRMTFASQIDLVGEDYTLYDIKTNSKLDDGSLLRYSHQLNIYRYLFELQTKKKVNALKILWINKNLQCDLIDIDFMSKRYIHDFLYSEQSWRYFEQFYK